MKSNAGRKLFQLAVLGAALLARVVLAQTVMQTSAPADVWTAIASSADGNKLVAVGALDLYTSTNSGVTWQSNNVPSYASNPYPFWESAASSADGTKIVAVSFNGPIYLSTNSGTTWSQAIVPSNNWVSVASSADGTKLVAVAGGNNAGPVYTSTNSGTVWSSNNLSAQRWTSVASSADGTKLVLASDGVHGLGSIYISTNSAMSWVTAGAPTNFWSSVASSANGCTLVAACSPTFSELPPTFTETLDTPGLIYTSTDSGFTWTSNNVPMTNWQAVAISADGSRLGVAIGGGVKGPIYFSTNFGTNWTLGQVASNNWISIVSTADGNRFMAAANNGGIYMLQLSQSPQLSLTSLSTNLTLAWIVPSTNFVLQQSTDLVAWATVTSPPALNLTNLQNQVTVSSYNSSSFYRLKTP